MNSATFYAGDLLLLSPTFAKVVLDRWRWRQLVIKCFRIRRLQRIFGYVGQFLQQYPSSLRARLQKELKKQ